MRRNHAPRVRGAVRKCTVVPWTATQPTSGVRSPVSSDSGGGRRAGRRPVGAPDPFCGLRLDPHPRAKFGTTQNDTTAGGNFLGEPTSKRVATDFGFGLSTWLFHRRC
jgi:hypothetical protein